MFFLGSNENKKICFWNLLTFKTKIIIWQEKDVFDIIQLVNTQNGTLTWMVVPDAQFTQEPFLPGTPEELMSTGQFNTGCSKSECILRIFLWKLFTQFLLEKFQNRNAKKVLLSLEGISTLQSWTIFANLKNNLSSKFCLLDKKVTHSYIQQTVQKLRLWLVIILMMESYFSFHTLRIQICGIFFKKTLMT